MSTTETIVRPDHSTLTDRARIDATTLREVARFAGTDEVRVVINAVAVWVTPDGVTLAATDSYRLLIDGTLPDGQPTYLLSLATVRDLIARTGKNGTVNLARTDTGEVWGESFDGKRQLRFGPSVIDTVAGHYPNVTGLLPDSDGEHSMDVTGAVTATLRSIGKVAGANRPVIVDGDGTATLKMEHGTWTAERFAVVTKGAPSVAYNAELLADVIDAVTLGGIAATLKVRDPLKPVVARGRGRTVLLMPMRVS